MLVVTSAGTWVKCFTLDSGAVSTGKKGSADDARHKFNLRLNLLRSTPFSSR